MKKYLSLITAAAVILSLTGCSKGEKLTSNGPPPLDILLGGESGSSSASSKPTESTGYEATDIGGTGPVTNFAEGTRDEALAEGFELTADAAVDGAIKGGADIAAPSATGTEVDGPCPVDPSIEPTKQIPPQAGLLTGGEWNDNEHWSDWNALYSSHEEWNSYKKAWENKTDYRLTVTVTADGKPLEGAKVSCEGCGTAVTNNKGEAYLFSEKMPSTHVLAAYGDKSGEKLVDWVPGEKDLYLSFELDGATQQNSKTLDLMIMCDTTGSMSDELEYLKVELENIVRKIKSDNANIPTNISVNFYRDETDEYVVRQFPFTDDIEKAAKAIQEQSADGGGDFPEAVHTALESAVDGHDWSENSVKIMFLVLDAPPHNDPQIIDNVNKYVQLAAEKGIRIVPIASSGIDKSTEYLLRTMAFTTGGTYTFLTDDSGVGDGHLKPTVGAYNVEKLSDMMVRIVNSYLK